MGYVFVFLFSYYTGPVFVSLLQGRFSVFCFNFDEETKQLFVGNYRLISLVLRDVWYVTLASRIKVCKIFFGVDLSEKIFLANECLFIYGTQTCIWFSSLRRIAYHHANDPSRLPLSAASRQEEACT